MTVKEYIAYEEKSEVRHEFINGQLFHMREETTFHNFICQNIFILLRKNQFLNRRGIFVLGVKVQIEKDRDYSYPDVMLTNDERDYANNYIVKFPAIIFQITSPSTKVNDKTDKFIRFRKITSLRYYIVVNSEKVDIEVFTKEGEDWTSENYTDIDNELNLSALNIKMKIEDIYEEVLKI